VCSTVFGVESAIWCKAGEKIELYRNCSMKLVGSIRVNSGKEDEGDGKTAARRLKESRGEDFSPFCGRRGERKLCWKEKYGRGNSV